MPGAALFIKFSLTALECKEETADTYIKQNLKTTWTQAPRSGFLFWFGKLQLLDMPQMERVVSAGYKHVGLHNHLWHQFLRGRQCHCWLSQFSENCREFSYTIHTPFHKL